MALYPNDPALPYLALIGSFSSPTWGETAVAFATFYHLVAKGEYLADAVQAMRVASGNTTWAFETAEASKKSYVDYISSLDASTVQAQLEQSAAKEPASDLAKLKSHEPRA